MILMVYILHPAYLLCCFYVGRLLVLLFATTSFTAVSTAATSNRNGEAKASPARHSSSNLADHALRWLSLKPDSSGPFESCHEESFTSSKYIGETLDHLDICRDGQA